MAELPNLLLTTYKPESFKLEDDPTIKKVAAHHARRNAARFFTKKQLDAKILELAAHKENGTLPKHLDQRLKNLKPSEEETHLEKILGIKTHLLDIDIDIAKGKQTVVADQLKVAYADLAKEIFDIIDGGIWKGSAELNILPPPPNPVLDDYAIAVDNDVIEYVIPNAYYGVMLLHDTLYAHHIHAFSQKQAIDTARKEKKRQEFDAKKISNDEVVTITRQQLDKLIKDVARQNTTSGKQSGKGNAGGGKTQTPSGNKQQHDASKNTTTAKAKKAEDNNNSPKPKGKKPTKGKGESKKDAKGKGKAKN